MPRPVRMSPLPTRLRRRPRIPAVGFRRRLEHRNRARALEAAVVGRAGLEQLQAELQRIGLRRRRRFVDERLGGERRLRAVRIAQVAGAQRRLPDERQADDLARHLAIRNRVHVRRRRRAAGGRSCPPRPHQLRDQHGVRLVVAEVVVVAGARVVVERDEIALRIEPAAHLDEERRALGVPRGLLVPHPLHANRPADLSRDTPPRTRIVRRGAAVALRALHPDDAHPIPRHAEERRDASRMPYDFMSFE